MLAIVEPFVKQGVVAVMLEVLVGIVVSQGYKSNQFSLQYLLW